MGTSMKATAAAAAVVIGIAAGTTVATAAPSPSQQAATIKQLRDHIKKQNRAIANRNRTIRELKAHGDQGWAEANRLGIALTLSLSQQIAGLSIDAVWTLMAPIRARFPSDPLGVYSASVFTSGSYQSYTFTRSP